MAKRKTKTVPPCRPVKGRPLRTKVRTDNGLTAGERDSCRAAAESLMNAFDWEWAAEGPHFWNDIYDRLLAISEGAPLK